MSAVYSAQDGKKPKALLGRSGERQEEMASAARDGSGAQLGPGCDSLQLNAAQPRLARTGPTPGRRPHRSRCTATPIRHRDELIGPIDPQVAAAGTVPGTVFPA